MSGEEVQSKENKNEKSLSLNSSHKQTVIKLCLVIFAVILLASCTYSKGGTVGIKTKNSLKENSTSKVDIKKEIAKDTDNNEKTILNISELPVVEYGDCIENGVYKISERDARREFTHVVSFSPKELLFINGYYQYGANKSGVAGAKQEKINQIEKYNIANDKYSKILNLPKAKIRMDKIPFDENHILLRDGVTLYSYNIPQNKLVLICDNFDYFMLFPYRNNEFLLRKNDNLYILNVQTKEIKFLKKLTVSIDYPLFKINDDLFVCLSGDFGNTKPIIYSMKQNKVYDELNISEINTVEKISDDNLLIIETVNPELKQMPKLKTAGNFRYIAYLYDIKNKKISKKIILKEQGAFKEKFRLTKLSNNNFYFITQALC